MTENFVAAKKKRMIIGIASAAVLLAATVIALFVGSSTKSSSPGAIITTTSAPSSISAAMFVNTTLDPNGVNVFKVVWAAPTTGAAAVTGYRVSCLGTGCTESGKTPIVERSTTLCEKLALSPTQINGAPVTFYVSAITATGDSQAISISKTLYVSTVGSTTNYALQ